MLQVPTWYIQEIFSVNRLLQAVISLPRHFGLFTQHHMIAKRSSHSVCVVAAARPMPLSKDGNAEMHVLPVPLTLLSAISTLRVSLPNDLRQPEPRRSTLLTLKVTSLWPLYLNPCNLIYLPSKVTSLIYLPPPLPGLPSPLYHNTVLTFKVTSLPLLPHRRRRGGK